MLVIPVSILYPFDNKKENVLGALLILAWNLKDEIMLQMEKIKTWGGKFVIPIPEVKIYK